MLKGERDGFFSKSEPACSSIPALATASFAVSLIIAPEALSAASETLQWPMPFGLKAKTVLMHRKSSRKSSSEETDTNPEARRNAI